jgi:hypothetical protein
MERMANNKAAAPPHTRQNVCNQLSVLGELVAALLESAGAGKMNHPASEIKCYFCRHFMPSNKLVSAMSLKTLLFPTNMYDVIFEERKFFYFL